MTTREPIVRTLHSYAYSLLRGHAVRTGEPVPRLLGAGESDLMVRELLAGQQESGRGGWPESVRTALSSPSFAAELRDLMMRTAERGISVGRLAELGRRRKRPEWQAAALFAREYQDVSDLRQGTSGLGAALDQAELTRAALALLQDDELLAVEQARVRRIFVDEYQDVDPGQAKLVDLVASGADEFVVFGDPDQSIYAFRGSDSRALLDVEVDRTVSLTVSRRLSAAVLVASRRIADRLPGALPHRRLTSDTAAGGPSSRSARDADGKGTPGLPAAGDVQVRTFGTAAQEAAYVADELRRAHLIHGVDWSQMAVLVRSPAVSLPTLRRAFAIAGVPLAVSDRDVELRDDPVVQVMMTAMHCGLRPELLTGQIAMDLMNSPVIGMDAQSLRRLRRELRAVNPQGGSTPDLLAAVLAGGPLPEGLPDDLERPVLRVRSILEAARAGAGDPAAETCLWDVWQRCELTAGLMAASARGGRAGQRADSTLDAVLTLFSMASDLADRMPLAGVEAFVDLVQGQHIPPDPTAGAARSSGAVSVLSAHASKGLEWDVVCLAGVSEGRWPVLRSKQSMLGVDEVMDAAAGLPLQTVDPIETVRQERQLFYVAATRARRRLIATSVLDQDTVPSRFLHELTGSEDDVPHDWPAGHDGGRRRGLHMTDLIAELRRAVTDPGVSADARSTAATQLARLAEAGVIGAHPRDWYGIAETSTDRPPVGDGVAVSVSPSSVDSLMTCALRGVLERRGARGPMTAQQIEGVVVHALVDGLAKGVAQQELLAEMEHFLALQHQLPPWLLARTRRALRNMLTAAQAWIAELPADRTLAGSEVTLTVRVPPVGAGTAPAGEGEFFAPEELESTRPPGLPPRTVLLAGRADRIDRAPDGSFVIVDFKTGATVPSKASVVENAQLAVYQLAVHLGAAERADFDARSRGSDDPPTSLSAGGTTDRPTDRTGTAGGAELVFLRSGLPVSRHQPPLEAADAEQWQRIVRVAAERLASSVSQAQENRQCDRCPVRSSCPLQPDGRQVTR